jgi:hypothetical protein
MLNLTKRGVGLGAAHKIILARGTCLSGAAAAMLLIAPCAASAADVCGPLVNGKVVCDPAAPIGTDGVTYSMDAPAPPQDLTVVLGEGLAIDTSGTTNTGVSVTNSAGGAVTISGAGTTITTDGLGARGVIAGATAGPVDVTVGDVMTSGDQAEGIFASANYGPDGGDVSVNAGVVMTSGAQSTGILSEAQYADINIKATQVYTSGLGSDGVFVHAHYGNASVDIGQVSTGGESGRALTVYSQGVTTVRADEVRTFGQGVGTEADAGAIKAVGTAVDIQVGQVSTLSDYAVGIYAVSNAVTFDPTIVHPDIVVNVDGVLTSGYASDAIVAIDLRHGGQTSVKAGSVSTTGDNAFGVYASAHGDVHVETGVVKTTGQASLGINAISFDGDITVKSGAVTTSGVGALGISVVNFSYGDNTISATSVKTTRDYADAIRAEAYGDVDLSVGTLATSGFQAFGATVLSFAGDVNVSAGSVSTHGDLANGIEATSYTGTVSLHAASASTTGDQAQGLFALAGGDVSLSADTVWTTGKDSRAVGAVSVYGDVDLKVGAITTSGVGSNAVFGQTFNGDLNIDIGSIVTTGGSARGLAGIGALLDAAGGDLNAHFGSIATSGDHAVGVFSHVRDGDSHIVLAGAVTTTGADSKGIDFYEFNGRATLDLSGSIATSGYGAIGIQADINRGEGLINAAGPITTKGDDASGIQAQTNSFVLMPDDYNGLPGPVFYSAAAQINANQITTSGARSDGIQVSTRHAGLYGDSPLITHTITVNTGAITVSGQDSRGIVINNSFGTLSVDAGTTSSAQSNAMVLAAKTQASLNIRGATVSKTTDAVLMEGGDVTVTVAAGGSVSGQSNGLVLTALGPAAAPPALVVARAPVSSGKVSLSNAGALNSGTGYAVLVQDGTTTFANSGVINGALKLAAGDDVVTNTGTFNADRDSDFGAGQDKFVNSGVVKVRAGATAPGAVTLLRLERFENAGGLVDLRNSQAGDVLTLPGDYVASGDARLGLDFSKTGSDTLVVAGAATGKTSILLAGLTPDKATLTPGAAPLVKVGAGSASDAFTIANPDAGFIHYALRYDAKVGGYVLAGQAGTSVYRAVKFGSAAQDIWDKSAQGWSGHLSALRDARSSGDAQAGRVWGQVFAASDSRDDQRHVIDGAGASQTYDLDFKQDYTGFQAGVDLVSKPLVGGDLVAGVTGGYLKSTLDFARSEQKATFDSVNLGGYASLTRGRLYANGLAQYAHHSVDVSDNGAGYAGSFKGATYGARLEAGARMGAGRMVIEPNASLTYLRSGLKDLQALGQTLDFDTAEGLKGRLGARVSGQSRLKNGQHLVFSAGAALVHDFDGDAGVTLVSGASREHLDDDRAKTWGQGTAGVSYTAKRGFTVYGQGQVDRGDGYRSVAAQVGVKLPF